MQPRGWLPPVCASSGRAPRASWRRRQADHPKRTHSRPSPSAGHEPGRSTRQRPGTHDLGHQIVSRSVAACLCLCPSYLCASLCAFGRIEPCLARVSQTKRGPFEGRGSTRVSFPVPSAAAACLQGVCRHLCVRHRRQILAGATEAGSQAIEPLSRVVVHAGDATHKIRCSRVRCTQSQ